MLPASSPWRLGRFHKRPASSKSPLSIFGMVKLLSKFSLFFCDFHKSKRLEMSIIGSSGVFSPGLQMLILIFCWEQSNQRIREQTKQFWNVTLMLLRNSKIEPESFFKHSIALFISCSGMFVSSPSFLSIATTHLRTPSARTERLPIRVDSFSERQTK